MRVPDTESALAWADFFLRIRDIWNALYVRPFREIAKLPKILIIF